MYTLESTSNYTIRDANGNTVLILSSAYPERVSAIVENLNNGSLRIEDLKEQQLLYATILYPTSAGYQAFKLLNSETRPHENYVLRQVENAISNDVQKLLAVGIEPFVEFSYHENGLPKSVTVRPRTPEDKD